MKSLSEHNEQFKLEMRAQHTEEQRRPTDIACDLCGTELMEPAPFNVFASWPPQIRVICPNKQCMFVGFAAK